MKIFNKVEIDFKSFFKKGVPKIEEPYGNFLVCGVMGSGKTYFCVKQALALSNKYKIKTNIHSLRLPTNNIEYFDTVEELSNDYEEKVLYIVDELGKKYTKDSKQDKDFYNWLQHSRKLKKIVFLIHQEYLLVPNWLRGACMEVYTTRKLPLVPILLTSRGYPVLNDETKEWEVESNYSFIYKRNKSITDLYNTFEIVDTL